MLELYSDYDRKAVRNIFEPEAPFTPGAGKWATHGAIRLPQDPNGFVFFVSSGQPVGKHEFSGDIDDSGLLRWQCQPGQTLDDQDVQAWIDHDPGVGAMHLLLRTAARQQGAVVPFTYLGELDYAGHDLKGEKAVSFYWRLKSWPIPQEVLDRTGLKIKAKARKRGETNPRRVTANVSNGRLTEIRPPRRIADDQEEAGRHPHPRLDFSFARNSARAREISLRGEQLVVDYEKRWLRKNGRADLADRVVNVAKEKGDAAGYDVLSYFLDGTEKYIEVKTTPHGVDTDFMMTANEVDFSTQYAGQYRLYRLCQFDDVRNAAKFYVLEGDVRKLLRLVPTEFRSSGIVAGSGHSVPTP